MATTLGAINEFATRTEDYFLWIAVEYSDWAKIRPRLRPIPKSRYINVAYRDVMEPEYASS